MLIIAIVSAVLALTGLIFLIRNMPSSSRFRDKVATTQAEMTSEGRLEHLAAEFPDSPGVLIEWTERAIGREEWPEAIRRAAIMRDAHPGRRYGYLAGARALMRAGQFQEAEELTEQAMRLFSDAPEPYVEHARIAQQQQLWPLARQRWKRVREKFPDEPSGHVALGIALVEMRAYDEADPILAKARELFSANEDAWRWFAAVAHRRGDWVEAANRWADLRSHFDHRPDGYLRGAEALLNAGHRSEAEKVIETGLFIFPKNKDMQRQHQAIFKQAQSAHSAPLPDSAETK